MSSTGASETRRLISAELAERLIAERTDQADAIVTSAFAKHLGDFGSRIAALSVGGFGRRELFPYSDIDVLVLTASSLPAGTLKEPLGHFLRDLWDAGLRISHSVHTVEECCEVNEQNIELTISLLDRRYLTGDTGLTGQLDSALTAFLRIHGKSIARHLARLTRARHAKFQSSIYHLEPNIKETPGAFRDLQTVRWLGKLLPEHPDPDLQPAWQFLAPIRVFLHETSRRDDNLLTFDMQEAMSDEPGVMMRSYYRYARTGYAAVSRALETAEESQPSLIRQFRDWRSRLSNSDFTVSRDRVFLRSPGHLTSDPWFFFRLVEFIARHGIPASTEAENKLSAIAPAIANTIAKQTFWPQLKSILSQPKASYALRLMQRTGLLAALLPEWAHIDCLVVRDFYHRYTVDEHTIVTIETLESIPDKRFRDVLAEVHDIALVRFALMFHDIGKGTGREHVGESDRLVAIAGPRIGIPPSELQTVRQLILRHLELSSTMNSRDMDDAGTARSLANAVGTVEQLKMLALLTYADISAVNPSAMTPWRSDQLWRVYLTGYEELTSELETVRIHNFAGADPHTVEFVEGLPNRYLRTHTIAEIQGHAALAGVAAAQGVGVELVRKDGYWCVVVATEDRPFLFASIAGALAAFGMNILKAEAFANSHGMILDTFTFADPMRTLELNPTEIERLQQTVAKVVLGKLDVKRLLANRRPNLRRPVRIEPTVGFNNKASQSATLIEIVAEDRPGLLYDLTSTMSGAGCNIVVVLIDTEASKALDVFYVTAGGQKLDESKEAALRRDLLALCAGS